MNFPKEYRKMQGEIASIITDMNDPDVEMKFVQKRLNQVLVQHKQLGIHILE
jgi:hypothetical protein